MTERVFFDHEVLTDFLTQGCQRLGLGDRIPEVKARFEPDRLAWINDQLLGIVESPDFSESVVQRFIQPAPGVSDEFASRILATRQGGVTTRAVFFRVKDSAEAVLIGTLSLAIGAFTGPAVALLPAGLSLVFAAWKNLRDLQRPKDATLLDTYDALVRAGINHALVHHPSEGCTLAQIESGHGCLVREANPQSQAPISPISAAELLQSLKQLAHLGLVEVVNASPNSANPDRSENRWRPRL